MLRPVMLCILVFRLATGYAEQPGFMTGVGAGFPNLPRFFFNYLNNEQGFRSEGTGPFHLKSEYRINRWLGAGLHINHMSSSVRFTNKYFDTTAGEILDNEVKVKYRNTSFNARLNLHFLDPETHENTQFYAGLGIGYRIDKLTTEATYQGGAPVIKLPPLRLLGLEFTLGYRKYISNHIGLYAEIGPAKSLIQAGLVVRY